MSRFWIVWTASQAPVTRYPGVRFIPREGPITTVRIYDAFKRNEFYTTGEGFVFPMVLPQGEYTVLVSTNPTYSGRVRVTRRESLTSAVVQIDPAPGLAGQLAVTITEVGAAAVGAAASEQTVSSVPFSNVAPAPEELTATEVAGCPDLTRSRQHRGLRQMLKNGQVPEFSAEAAQFWAPQGVVPDQVDAYGVPFASQGGQDWGRWR